MQHAARQKTNEEPLAVAAQEYEDYAYIVSHDLNAPLRHIKQFTRLLLDARGDLSDEEQEYAGFLEKSLQRIDNMQDALLTFSRVSTRCGPMNRTDCGHIAQQIIGELKPAYPNVNFECMELPVISADPKQIYMLFLNLIENAAKFHDKKSKERYVSIRAVDQGDLALFEIRDNGIGIGEDHTEEVFRLFRRIYPDKFPGTGAGLTIARKIVRQHGGEIYLTSELKRGTNVIMSLPKNL